MYYFLYIGNARPLFFTFYFLLFTFFFPPPHFLFQMILLTVTVFNLKLVDGLDVSGSVGGVGGNGKRETGNGRKGERHMCMYLN